MSGTNPEIFWLQHAPPLILRHAEPIARQHAIVSRALIDPAPH